MTSDIVSPPGGGQQPLLSLRGITKSFGAVDVLKGVDLDCYLGQVTALVGDNGAGKSTLVKGIAGTYTFDGGSYLFEGREVHVTSPKAASDLGIEVVYQDLALCDNLDVVHNMFLGREAVAGIVMDETTMERRASETLRGLSVRTLKSVRTSVSRLSGGQRQTVAIARAVLWNSKLVILDEPTAALGVAQTEQVLNLVRRLADSGLAVILISHNMNDVKQVADTVAALYLGQLAATVRADDVTTGQIVELITTGRSGDLGLAAERGAEVTTTTAQPATPSEDVPERATLGSAARDYLTRVRGGDVGSLPAIAGFIFLVVLFTILRPDNFATKLNWANLLNQSAAVIFIAMGLVFVLLLGEIDLSAGYTAGVGAGTLAVLLTFHGWPWPAAFLAALVVGVVIGLLIGLLVARLGIPSFVVTLSAFLALQGVLLTVIGTGGTVPVRDPFVLSLMNDNMPPVLGWIMWVVVVAGYALAELLGRARRTKAGLPSPSVALPALRIAVLAVLLGLVVYLFNLERAVNPAIKSLKGVPLIVPIAVVFVVVLSFVLKRTRFGQHIYAVGGNAEAARRAGIDVNRIKIACFMISSTLAAFGGLLLASRANSVSPSTGGASTLLLAVGAAVIGGTSLFGGKGRIIDAIIGGLVIAVIQNGLPLITQRAEIQFIVTGLVLLLAASVDAISRRRAAASGR